MGSPLFGNQSPLTFFFRLGGILLGVFLWDGPYGDGVVRGVGYQSKGWVLQLPNGFQGNGIDGFFGYLFAPGMFFVIVSIAVAFLLLLIGRGWLGCFRVCLLGLGGCAIAVVVDVVCGVFLVVLVPVIIISSSSPSLGGSLTVVSGSFLIGRRLSVAPISVVIVVVSAILLVIVIIIRWRLGRHGLRWSHRLTGPQRQDGVIVDC